MYWWYRPVAVWGQDVHIGKFTIICSHTDNGRKLYSSSFYHFFMRQLQSNTSQRNICVSKLIYWNMYYKGGCTRPDYLIRLSKYELKSSQFIWYTIGRYTKPSSALVRAWVQWWILWVGFWLFELDVVKELTRYRIQSWNFATFTFEL